MRPLVLSFLVLALAALGLSGAALALDESEPNDTPAQANAAPFDTDLRGNASFLDTDYWAVDVNTSGVIYVLSEASSGCTSFAVTGEGGADLPHTMNPSIASTWIVVDHPQLVNIEVCDDPEWTGPYHFQVVYGGMPYGAQGADETELNNDPANATPLPLLTYKEGRQAIEYPDVDYWRIDPDQSGWIRLNITDAISTGATFSTASGPAESRGPFAYGASGYFPLAVYYVNASAGVPIFVRMSPDTPAYYYHLYAEFIGRLEAVVEGSGERERNDGPAESSPIVPCVDGCVYTGALDAFLDTVDYYSIPGEAGDLVTLHFSFPDYSGGMVSLANLGQPWHYSWGGNYSSDSGYYGSSEQLRLFYNAARSETLVVTLRSETARYTIQLQVTQHPDIYADGYANITELDGADYFCCSARAAHWVSDDPYGGSETPPADFEGYLWGETLCLENQPDNAVGPVVVSAGTIFRPEWGSLPHRSFVVTRSVIVDLAGWGYGGCLRAIALEKDGEFSRYNGPPYHPSGMAEGDLLKLVLELDANHTNCEGGLLAVWGVTIGLNLTVALNWTANRTTVLEAQQLLDNAGANVLLNAPAEPAPPVPPPPGQNNTTGPPPSTTNVSAPAPNGFGLGFGLGLGGGLVTALAVGLYVGQRAALSVLSPARPPTAPGTAPPAPPPPPPAALVACAQCGTRFSKDASKCPRCGLEVWD